MNLSPTPLPLGRLSQLTAELADVRRDLAVALASARAWRERALGLAESVDVARREEREEAAKVAEGGSFLHADAPAARFGRACARAIRLREPLP